MTMWDRIVHKIQPRITISATIAFGVVIIALLWAGVSVKYYDNIRSSRSQAIRENDNLSRVFEENVLRSIGEIDKSLLYLRRTIEAQIGKADIYNIIDTKDLLSEIIVEVGVIDRHGFLLASNAGVKSDARIDLSDREHFQFQRQHNEDVLFISQPVVGRASGKWSVQFTRRLRGANDDFAGVVVGSLDPDYLTRFYNSINFGSSTAIALIGNDGIVRSSGGSRIDVGLGANISAVSLFKRAQLDGGGTFETIDQTTRNRTLVTYRQVHGQPLWLSVTRNLEEDFAEPVNSLFRNAWAATMITIVILIALLRIFSAEQHARRNAQQLRLTLDNIGQGIMLLSAENKIQVINENCCKLLGCSRESLNSDAPTSSETILQMTQMMRSKQTELRQPQSNDAATLTTIFERQMADGKIVEIRSSPVTGGSVVCTLTDITAQRRTEQHILRLASEDSLTNLPNRRSFVGALRELLQGTDPARPPDAFAVLFLDLDRFKTINDSLGHRVGDLLLIEISDRLRKALPADTMIARLGGDEFAIALPSITSPVEVERHAQRLIAAVNRPFLVDGYRILTGTSIGIALAPTDANDVDGLLAAADLALYSAKGNQRGTYRFYTQDLAEGLEERRRIESDLRLALENNGLAIHYQPLIDLKTGTLSGFEALARWKHQALGMIPPDKFIPVAEETGLIVKLGEWALRTACQTAVAWPGTFKVAVNVSPIQLLAPGMVGVVQRALRDSGLAPDRLEVEVTERILLQESGQTREILEDLKALGVRIVLDDFGTGYSSLSYLRTFSFDKVKIDRSFISDLTLGTDRTVIIQAVISIAKSLGMETTAEGVEVDYQRELLTALGCDQAQGYLIAKALPSADLDAFIKTWAGATHVLPADAQSPTSLSA